MSETMAQDRKAFLSEIPTLDAALIVQRAVRHGNQTELDRLARLIGFDALQVLHYAALRQRPPIRRHHEARGSRAEFDPKEAVDDGWLTPAKVRKQMADGEGPM